jgi:uncharacterized membrane-anchored protein
MARDLSPQGGRHARKCAGDSIMLQRLLTVLFVVGLLALDAPAAFAAAPEGPPTAEQKAERARLDEIVSRLHPRTGQVTIPQAKASLALGETYYFLDAADARTVLTELWGNPPSAAEGVLGMVFPKDRSPLDDTWGAVVSYTADGYVSDADAAKIDPDELLTQLRQGEDEDNRQRQANGFATVHLAGWAQPPAYNARKHNLIWAKTLAFGDTQDQTLNYDVRVLGRRGVLSLNIVAELDDLATVGPAAAQLMETAQFDAGERYTDYKPGQDAKASYGVAGLIAGGAALAVAKKAGLLGIVLIVLKKGGVLILAGAGAAWAWLRRLMGAKTPSPAAAGAVETYDPAAPDPGLAPAVPAEEPSPSDEEKL